MIRYPHFKCIEHDGELVLCRKIFCHPWLGWEIVSVLSSRRT